MQTWIKYIIKIPATYLNMIKPFRDYKMILGYNLK